MREDTRLPGDVNDDGRFDREDITRVLQSGMYLVQEVADFDQGDWNRDRRFDAADVIFALQKTGWTENASSQSSPRVEESSTTGVPGDTNGDGQFDQLDLIMAMQSDRFMSGRPATAEQGDWNGDGYSDQADLIAALQFSPLTRLVGSLPDLPRPGDANGDGSLTAVISFLCCKRKISDWARRIIRRGGLER